jgi:hypothetical protein
MQSVERIAGVMPLENAKIVRLAGSAPNARQIDPHRGSSDLGEFGILRDIADWSLLGRICCRIDLFRGSGSYLPIRIAGLNDCFL